MAPSTGIEPATSCSTGSRPLQGTTRARRRSVVMVRRGGFAPPQPLAAGLRPAGLACARAGAGFTTHVWLAMPIRFSRCGPGFSGQKEKGPGVARPLLLTPLLVVRVPIAPTEESPGPVTLDWVP